MSLSHANCCVVCSCELVLPRKANDNNGDIAQIWRLSELQILTSEVNGHVISLTSGFFMHRTKISNTLIPN